MCASIGIQELLLILFIVLFLFGAKKLPDMARGMGNAIKEFRKATKDSGVDDLKSEISKAIDDKPEETKS